MLLRPTEDKGLFQFVVGGDFDLEKVFSDDQVLVQTMKEISGRNDLVFGEIKTKSDWR